MSKVLFAALLCVASPSLAKSNMELKAAPPKVAIISPLDMNAAMACVLADKRFGGSINTLNNDDGSVDLIVFSSGVRLMIITFKPVEGKTVVEGRGGMAMAVAHVSPCLSRLSPPA